MAHLQLADDFPWESTLKKVVRLRDSHYDIKYMIINSFIGTICETGPQLGPRKKGHIKKDCE